MTLEKGPWIHFLPRLSSAHLVGAVEEHNMLLVLENTAELGPLLGGWIDSRWVVGASVEQEDRLVGRSLDVSHEPCGSVQRHA